MVCTKSISLVIPFLAALQGVHSNPISTPASSSNLAKRIAQNCMYPTEFYIQQGLFTLQSSPLESQSANHRFSTITISAMLTRNNS